jgi:hypothetical protein
MGPLFYSRMEKNKSYLLEALAKKGLALCEMYETSADKSAPSLEDIQNIFNEIVKFVEPTDTKVYDFFVHIIFRKFLNSMNCVGHKVFSPSCSGTKSLRKGSSLALQTAGGKTYTRS